MNLNILQLALRNKHTSIAGVAFFAIEPAEQLASLWFPTHRAQIEQSAKILKGAVAAYGFIAAGDANKSATKYDVQNMADAAASAIKSGDTSILTKPKTVDNAAPAPTVRPGP